MRIISLVVGPISTNCYIVACERSGEAIVIDPGFNRSDEGVVLEKIHDLKLSVKCIVNTHGHVDHISGNMKLKRETGASIMIHTYDADMLVDPIRNGSIMMGLNVVSPPPDIMLQDGDEIKVGELRVKVLHTPGHTPGSISLYIEEERVVFTGDTLFAGSIGRTDFPGSSYEKIMLSIRERLLSLPDDTRVYPGHGPWTTIGIERRENPFLL
ncbi:MAG: MBL fold metallo-hydrolase [Candidatus Bathyarchaeia archaeon]|nr:MBL fold metallo-hydrolase [Candidatus Bathyarchaeota archaeon]